MAATRGLLIPEIARASLSAPVLKGRRSKSVGFPGACGSCGVNTSASRLAAVGVRRRVHKVIVRLQAVVYGVPPTARRASLQAAHLRE
jgi:hypothetical protein